MYERKVQRDTCFSFIDQSEDRCGKVEFGSDFKVKAGSLNYVLLLGLFRAIGIFVVELMNVFEAPATETSTLFSTFGLSFTVSALLLNTALDGIFHERALVVTGITVSSLGFIISFFATNLETITIAVGFCTGVGAQTLATSSQSLVSRYFNNRLSLALGLVALGGSIGGFIWPVALRFLIDEFTFRGASLIIASIILNGYVCAALMRPFEKVKRKLKSSQSTNGKSTESEATTETIFVVQPLDNLAFVEDERIHPHKLEIWNNKMTTQTTKIDSPQSICNAPGDPVLNAANRGVLYWIKTKGDFVKQFIFVTQKDRKQTNYNKLSAKELLTNPMFYLFQLFTFLSGTGLQYITLYYPAITEELGFSKYQSAIFLSVVGISDGIAQLLLGFVGDYVSDRKIIVMISHAVLSSSIFLCHRAVSFWPQIICAAAIGLSLTPSFLYRLPLIRDIFGEKASLKLLSLNICASGLSIIGGGPLYGWLRDSSGGYARPMYVAVAALLAGCVVLITMDILRRLRSGKSKIYMSRQCFGPNDLL